MAQGGLASTPLLMLCPCAALLSYESLLLHYCVTLLSVYPNNLPTPKDFMIKLF